MTDKQETIIMLVTQTYAPSKENIIVWSGECLEYHTNENELIGYPYRAKDEQNDISLLPEVHTINSACHSPTHLRERREWWLRQPRLQETTLFLMLGGVLGMNLYDPLVAC